jgi:hypothetical protein
MFGVGYLVVDGGEWSGMRATGIREEAFELFRLGACAGTIRKWLVGGSVA